MDTWVHRIKEYFSVIVVIGVYMDDAQIKDNAKEIKEIKEGAVSMKKDIEEKSNSRFIRAMNIAKELKEENKELRKELQHTREELKYLEGKLDK